MELEMDGTCHRGPRQSEGEKRAESEVSGSEVSKTGNMKFDGNRREEVEGNSEEYARAGTNSDPFERSNNADEDAVSMAIMGDEVSQQDLCPSSDKLIGVEESDSKYYALEEDAGREDEQVETHIEVRPATGGDGGVKFKSRADGSSHSFQHTKATCNTLLEPDNRIGLMTPYAATFTGTSQNMDLLSTKSAKGSGEHDDVSLKASHQVDTELLILQKVAEMAKNRRQTSLRPLAMVGKTMNPGADKEPQSGGWWKALIGKFCGKQELVPVPPSHIVCAFCQDLLRFPVTMPCKDMCCLECLSLRAPVAMCPRCSTATEGIYSLNDLGVTESTQRKIDRDKQLFLLKARRLSRSYRSTRKRRFLSCSKPKPHETDKHEADKNSGSRESRNVGCCIRRRRK